jgi:hypothetical protein
MRQEDKERMKERQEIDREGKEREKNKYTSEINEKVEREKRDGEREEDNQYLMKKQREKETKNYGKLVKKEIKSELHKLIDSFDIKEYQFVSLFKNVIRYNTPSVTDSVRPVSTSICLHTFVLNHELTDVLERCLLVPKKDIFAQVSGT